MAGPITLYTERKSLKTFLKLYELERSIEPTKLLYEKFKPAPCRGGLPVKRF